MLFWNLMLVVIGVVVGVPPLFLLVVAALLQGFAAYRLTRYKLPLRWAEWLVLATVAYFAVDWMLTPAIAEADVSWFEPLLYVAATLCLLVGTVVGIVGAGEPQDEALFDMHRHPHDSPSEKAQG